MSKADGGLRKEIQRHLPKPEWHWTPIESGGTHGGIPDSHYVNTKERAAGWVESKKTDGWAVEVRPHQSQWIKIHTAAGVRCFFAIRAMGRGSSGGRGDSLWIVRGDAVDELQEHGLRLDPMHVLAVWQGPPASWNWDALAALLTS